jgi:hypothetical protein
MSCILIILKIGILRVPSLERFKLELENNSIVFFRVEYYQIHLEIKFLEQSKLKQSFES